MPLLVQQKEGTDYSLNTIDIQNILSSESANASESGVPELTSLKYILSPVQLASWNSVMKGEFSTALKQQPDALSKGITLIIKKNGKVGSRRFGVPLWSSLVEDVENRKQRGLDISNI